jgi:hypothetical protein
MEAYARIPLLAALPADAAPGCLLDQLRTGRVLHRPAEPPALRGPAGQCAWPASAAADAEACCEHVERRAVLRAQPGAAARLADTPGPLVRRGVRCNHLSH